MILKKYLPILLLVATSACGGSYEYTPRMAQEIPAIAQAAVGNEHVGLGGSSTSTARLLSINGVSVSAHYLFLTFDSSQILSNNRVPFSPGMVTLNYYLQAEAVSGLEVSFTFEAQPGETYAPRILAANAPAIQLVNSRGLVVPATPVIVP